MVTNGNIMFVKEEIYTRHPSVLNVERAKVYVMNVATLVWKILT